MTEPTISEQAERLSARRARLWPILAILFIAQQAVYFSDAPQGARAVDGVHVSAWLVMSVVILLALVTGGGWIYPKAVRDRANDEGTRMHRVEAFRAGFIAAMLGCIALYVVNLFAPLSGSEAIHLILTIGLGAALLRFGILERQALRGA